MARIQAAITGGISNKQVQELFHKSAFHCTCRGEQSLFKMPGMCLLHLQMKTNYTLTKIGFFNTVHLKTLKYSVWNFPRREMGAPGKRIENWGSLLLNMGHWEWKCENSVILFSSAYIAHCPKYLQNHYIFLKPLKWHSHWYESIDEKVTHTHIIGKQKICKQGGLLGRENKNKMGHWVQKRVSSGFNRSTKTRGSVIG